MTTTRILRTSGSKRLYMLTGIVVLLSACRVGSLLNAPQPVGTIIPGSALNSAAGAKQAYLGALAGFDNTLVGSGTPLWYYSEELSDELMSQLNGAFDVSEDARYAMYNPVAGIGGDASGAASGLLQARSNLLLVEPLLAGYETGTDRSMAGEAYALTGYTELLLAEDFCAGVPLDYAVPGGGVAFGTPLTTDSLLGAAIVHFNQALANAFGNDTVTDLASIGLARALLDRGQQYYGQADTVLTNANVPVGFVYNLVNAQPAASNNILKPNMMNFVAYQSITRGYSGDYWLISDREGGAGLNYISAADPRLVFDSSLRTSDAAEYGVNGYRGSYDLPDSIWYFPLKFGNPVGTGIYFPLATGVEAQLILAEAALQNDDPTTWATDLNNLRAAAQTTYLQLSAPVPLLPADSMDATGTAAVQIMFRERAFWLYGTMTRLGDMRREIRQYNQPADSVFPHGAYLPSGWANTVGYSLPYQTYGNDVALSLPVAAQGNTTVNPSYHGCLTPTTTP